MSGLHLRRDCYLPFSSPFIPPFDSATLGDVVSDMLGDCSCWIVELSPIIEEGTKTRLKYMRMTSYEGVYMLEIVQYSIRSSVWRVIVRGKGTMNGRSDLRTFPLNRNLAGSLLGTCSSRCSDAAIKQPKPFPVVATFGRCNL